MDEHIKRLVSCDELQNWGEQIPDLKGVDRKGVFEKAVPLWTHRMVGEGKLLLNPMVVESLMAQKWVPDDLQKQMIWASIVCKLDGPDGKAEKAKIRGLLQRRYGNDWWEEVYERAGRVWPAWDRYRKNILSMGGATKMLAKHSTVFGMAVNDELNAVMSMVPSR